MRGGIEKELKRHAACRLDVRLLKKPSSRPYSAARCVSS